MRLFFVALLALALAGCTTTGGWGTPPTRASVKIACDSVPPTYNAVMILVDGGVIKSARDIDTIKEVNALVTDTCAAALAVPEGESMAAYYATVTTAAARLIVIAAKYGVK